MSVHGGGGHAPLVTVPIWMSATVGPGRGEVDRLRVGVRLERVGQREAGVVRALLALDADRAGLERLKTPPALGVVDRLPADLAADLLADLRQGEAGHQRGRRARGGLGSAIECALVVGQ